MANLCTMQAWSKSEGNGQITEVKQLKTYLILGWPFRIHTFCLFSVRENLPNFTNQLEFRENLIVFVNNKYKLI